MDRAGELLGQHLVDQALTLDPRLAGERRGDDSHREVGLAARPRSDVAGVVMAVVDHLQRGRLKGGGELLGQGAGNGHEVAPGACERRLHLCGVMCLPGQSGVPILDSAMVKRTHDFEDFLRAERPPVMERRCDMPSCACAGEYRAPKARNRLNEYFWFCLDHVRAYNAQWDYYAGMSTVEIEAHLRADTLWHRPTWPLGGRQAKGPQDQGRQYHFRDPFGLFDDVFEEGPAARASAEAGAQSNPRHRPPPPQ